MSLMFWKDITGKGFKEVSRGALLICYDLYSPSLSTEKYHFSIGKQEIINMACGCGVGCLAGASKNEHF